jgi:hypothetical protein
VIVWRRILDLPQPHVAHAFVFEGRMEHRALCSFGRKHGFKMVPCDKPEILHACMACWKQARQVEGDTLRA